MTDKMREAIFNAVQSEDPVGLSEIVEIFREAGANYKDIFEVFKMACPYLDLPEYERLMQIAETA